VNCFSFTFNNFRGESGEFYKYDPINTIKIIACFINKNNKRIYFEKKKDNLRAIIFYTLLLWPNL